MSVSDANRRGIIHTLCQGVTDAGKPRYSFVRGPKGKRVVEAIPERWEIGESVNGIVKE